MNGNGLPLPAGTGVRDDPWIGRLLDEYKILQDKLDKIGSFRFTIKGWSVTVTAASLAAATATNASAIAVMLSLLLIAMVFFQLEWRQHRLGAIYADRVAEIETTLARVRSGSLVDLSSVRFIPGIANAVSRVALRNRDLVPWRKVRRDSDYLIYAIQGVVILGVTVIALVRAPDKAPNPAAQYIIMAPTANPPQAEPSPQRPESVQPEQKPKGTSLPKQTQSGKKDGRTK